MCMWRGRTKEMDVCACERERREGYEQEAEERKMWKRSCWLTLYMWNLVEDELITRVAICLAPCPY